jgi:succinyl-diaminopimelate desuccinylase
MYGRGVADAKVAVSLFCHLARELKRSKALTSGALHVLLDGDEHTGRFGGVRAYIEGIPARPDFVAVGYPGNWGVKIGARGFYRTKLSTFGQEAHSGARTDTTSQNAIVKMAHLIRFLSETPLPSEPDTDFAFGPKMSVTSIVGGNGYSQIPGQCEANLDVRLTPAFTAHDAQRLIEAALTQVDAAMPTSRSSMHDQDSTWPPYRLDPNSSFVSALQAAAEAAFKKEIHTVVVGPSNIGNYLASLGIPATCGFGVSYDHQHAADEYIEISTIAPVFETYYRAAVAWCSSSEIE